MTMERRRPDLMDFAAGLAVTEDIFRSLFDWHDPFSRMSDVPGLRMHTMRTEVESERYLWRMIAPQLFEPWLQALRPDLVEEWHAGRVLAKMTHVQ